MVFSQILFLKLTVFYRSFGGKGGIVISLNLMGGWCNFQKKKKKLTYMTY